MENKSDILNSLVNLPQKLKDNTEAIEKANQEVKEIKKQLGTVISGFTKNIAIIEEIKEKIKIEDLKVIEENFYNTINLLKQDLNSVIIKDVTNQFKIEIDNIIKPKIADINKANTELLNTINTVNSNFKELEKQQEQLKQGIKEVQRIVKKNMVRTLLSKFYITCFTICLLFFYLILIKVNYHFSYMHTWLGLGIFILLVTIIILSVLDLLHHAYIYIFTSTEED
jgi:paraquat-inducible protein B